ncbi:SDH4 [Auxenochlorella protothecoides x Auxenochlorella symbiontica]|uniref:Succinate dehydrogenase [ubiquinone] cytochrome b small subunit n=1 Tax=Auxenochlorella protothecoides TaxID=3075 RepID=A0A087SSH9_AUXPR|nr:Succinate dehydrogenase [ubiquinone] cytochrome b small subunit, mitochondrial [Auxenochlorella protothecoides]KFM28683.1 Succinate dehydrogenase [ubiquinone] cytochrome b small subunit, mitochondrial [Auxenochlorella protothecoides]RMZ55663.1 hypothetical protein APUTEX25_000246 [Auxenochlorella protothecoides]|eukprot:RMZ55663.1 hypothetical protein APUTEX25_000246 [Auxenochlorella protothecoides]
MASGFVYADTSKGLYKLFHKSHFALAGLVPATLALPSDGFPAKLADVGLAAVLPLHSHVAMNSVVTDYVPKALQLPARAGVIGLSAVTFIGLMKLSLTGDGIGGTVKKIWAGPQKA